MKEKNKLGPVVQSQPQHRYAGMLFTGTSKPIIIVPR